MKEHIRIFQIFAALTLVAVLSFLVSENSQLRRWRFFKTSDSYFVDTVTRQWPPENFDLLVLGSSLSAMDIDSPHLRKEFSIKALSLVHFHHGIEVDYLFLKKFLERHKTKAVILNVTSTANFFPHQWVPFLSDFQTFKEILGFLIDQNGTESLKKTVHFFSVSILDLSTFLYVVPIDWLMADKCSASEYCKELLKTNGFLFGTEKLKEIMARPTDLSALDSKGSAKSESALETLDFEIKLKNHEKYYYEKIANLAKANNVKLIFVQLPVHGTTKIGEDLKNFFESKGIFIAAPDLKMSADKWRDSFHFNHDGARIYTNWLAQELKKNNL